MRAFIAWGLMAGLMLSLSAVGCKKEEQPVVERTPTILPEPRRLGKCKRVVEQYLPNNDWKGYDECAYQSWMWDCPSAPDEQAECHRRVDGQLPPEKP